MIMATANSTTSTSSLHLPRILCLHGGGVNATIFMTQFRSFLKHPLLTSRFRFVFAEAPFFCDEAVGIHPVYSDWGPFRRWVRWLPTHPEIENAACRSEVLYACQAAIDEDQKASGTGEWVGILGFSQGAKVALSLLYETQIAKQEQIASLSANGKPIEWRFGIAFAGRAPFVALSEASEGFAWNQTSGGLPEAADMHAILDRPDMRLQIPTVHVHGLRDEGLALHQRLFRDYCAPGTATLVEWDGPHRLPLKMSDVDKVVKAIIEIADEYEV